MSLETHAQLANFINGFSKNVRDILGDHIVRQAYAAAVLGGGCS